jgi:hypothetical protein
VTLRERLEVVGIVALTVVSLGLGSRAILSGPRSVEGADLFRIEISSVDLTAGARATTFTAKDMMPGDSATASITVANSGRQSMAFGMSRGVVSAEGTALSEALVLTIKTVGSSCADYDGETLYDGPLAEAAFGENSDGHPLPAATAEILCFRAVLPLDTGNEVQGTATTVLLSFHASAQATSL